MATTKKALDFARDLMDVWAKEVKATLPIITETFDASGNPVITLSADVDPAHGEKVVVVLIKPYATGTATDVFGNTATAFTPHIIQVCTEMNYAATTDGVADILTPVEILPVLAEVIKKGTIVEWHQTANGTVPSEAAITAGTVLKSTYRDLYWTIQSAQ
jgi:hypothetical protein